MISIMQALRYGALLKPYMFGVTVGISICRASAPSWPRGPQLDLDLGTQPDIFTSGVYSKLQLGSPYLSRQALLGSRDMPNAGARGVRDLRRVRLAAQLRDLPPGREIF